MNIHLIKEVSGEKKTQKEEANSYGTYFIIQFNRRIWSG